METEITQLSKLILERFVNREKLDAVLVGISGIDASGKGFISEQLRTLLERENKRVALVHLDDWQQLKGISLLKENADENFYFNAFRWDGLINQVIHPLKKNRKLTLQINKVKMERDEIERARYDFNEVDIILLEGIFLFKQELRTMFDFRIWIECSFETGLQRALKRNMEGLPQETLIHDYHTYYYPAQHFHFERDKPQEAADVIFSNESEVVRHARQ